MIELKVDEYCHNCPEFEAQVDKVYRTYKAEPEVHTTVTCEHRSKCECIRKCVESQCENMGVK